MESLKTILGELGLKFRFETAVVDAIEDINTRIYALEENRRLKDPTIQGLQKQIGELRLMLADIQRELRKLN